MECLDRTYKKDYGMVKVKLFTQLDSQCCSTPEPKRVDFYISSLTYIDRTAQRMGFKSQGLSQATRRTGY